MTDKEKLEKLKKLADAMYYAAQYLTTDASRLRKTMEDYHQFIINEYHKEEPKPKFKVGDRIKFKGIYNEDVTRVITNIQKGDGDGFRYFFADGSIHSIGDDEIELVEEPVSDKLEIAAEEYGIRQGAELKPFATKFFKAGAQWQKTKDQSTIELAEDHAMLAGMEKMKEEMMKGAVEGYVTLTMTGVPTVAATVPEGKYNFDDKVKLIIIKED